MSRIAEVPADSVHFHTFGSLSPASPLTTAYGNDFARWAALEIGDRALRRASRRRRSVRVSAARRAARPPRRDSRRPSSAARGRRPPRVRSRVSLPALAHRRGAAPLGAATLAEFRAGLARVDESAIYLHTVETRVGGRRAEAFPTWLRDALGMPELAERFERGRPVSDDARAGPWTAPRVRRRGAGGRAGMSRIDDYRRVRRARRRGLRAAARRGRSRAAAFCT